MAANKHRNSRQNLSKQDNPTILFFFSILQAFTLLVIKIANTFYLHYLEAFDPCSGGIHCGDSFKFLILSKVSKRFPHLSPAILSFLSEINFSHPSLLNFYRANGFKVITVDWTEAKNNERLFAAIYFFNISLPFFAIASQWLLVLGQEKCPKLSITAKLGVSVQKILICHWDFQIITNYQNIEILSFTKRRAWNPFVGSCHSLTAVAHKLTKLQTDKSLFVLLSLFPLFQLSTHVSRGPKVLVSVQIGARQLIQLSWFCFSVCVFISWRNCRKLK